MTDVFEEVGAGPSTLTRWLSQRVGPSGRALAAEGRLEPFLATGRLTIEQCNEDVAGLKDDEYEWRSQILWTAWEQRPMDDPV